MVLKGIAQRNSEGKTSYFDDFSFGTIPLDNVFKGFSAMRGRNHAWGWFRPMIACAALRPSGSVVTEYGNDIRVWRFPHRGTFVVYRLFSKGAPANRPNIKGAMPFIKYSAASGVRCPWSRVTGVPSDNVRGQDLSGQSTCSADR